MNEKLKIGLFYLQQYRDRCSGYERANFFIDMFDSLLDITEVHSRQMGFDYCFSLSFNYQNQSFSLLFHRDRVVLRLYIDNDYFVIGNTHVDKKEKFLPMVRKEGKFTSEEHRVVVSLMASIDDLKDNLQLYQKNEEEKKEKKKLINQFNFQCYNDCLSIPLDQLSTDDIEKIHELLANKVV